MPVATTGTLLDSRRTELRKKNENKMACSGINFEKKRDTIKYLNLAVTAYIMHGKAFLSVLYKNYFARYLNFQS